MKTLDQKKKILNSLISMCKTASGDSVPDEFTIQDISKIECMRYPTQQVETVRVFFRTKGSRSNNKPYTYIEELPIGSYNELSQYLYDVRTKNTEMDIGSIFSSIHKKDNPKLTSKQLEELKGLGYEN